jgi:repressor LexA
MVTILTNKQFKILQAIQKYLQTNQYSPSLGDLQQMTGIRTKRGVVHYLEALERKGYIRRASSYRGIQIIKPDLENSRFISIPILGYANCGQPLAIATEENIGLLEVDRDIVPHDKDLFAVITKGDSMNKKKINKTFINNNDYVIVAKNREVKDGDVVLALINEGSTIKTFKKDNDMIVLYPESDNEIHQPIFLKSDNDGLIVGKVIAVLNNPTNKN